jgi:hypothetical protein
MPGPLVTAGIVVGSTIAGKILRGSTAKPRSFSQFLSEFESVHGPARFGLTSEEYNEALRTGRTEVIRQRDRATNLGLEQLRQSGLGRSAAAGTVGLRSAAAAEQAFTGLLSKLSALDAQLAERQKFALRSQAITAFNAEGAENARVAAENAQADAQFSQQLGALVDPIESFFLLRDLRTLRSFESGATAPGTPETDDLFATAEQEGRFDLNLRGAN